jgi:hypothetical protein
MVGNNHAHAIVYISQSTLSKTSDFFLISIQIHGKYTNFTPRGESSLHGKDLIVVPFVVNICYQIQKEPKQCHIEESNFLFV